MHRDAYILAENLSHEMTRQSAITAAEEGDGLLVMNTGEGARLLMEIYTDYVSEYNFANFPTVMKKLDRVLYEARGNKPFTHEERKALEETAPAPRRKKKKKVASAPPSVPAPAVTAMVHALTASFAEAA